MHLRPASIDLDLLFVKQQRHWPCQDFCVYPLSQAECLKKQNITSVLGSSSVQFIIFLNSPKSRLVKFPIINIIFILLAVTLSIG